MEALDELQLSAPLLQLISLQTATNQDSQCISLRALQIKGQSNSNLYVLLRCLSLFPSLTHMHNTSHGVTLA